MTLLMGRDIAVPTLLSPAAPDRHPEVPIRAEGLQLLGAMRGSGYRAAPSLARRVDGQTVQLTPLLALVLENIDGRRDMDAIADVVSSQYGRDVTGADVARLLATKLEPRGLLTGAEGEQPRLRRSNPLLALRWRLVVSNPRATRAIARPFTLFFKPLLMV